MTDALKRSARLTGPERDKVTKKVVAMYNKKKSVREIADEIGRSYGNVHRMLTDAGVEFRPRGGATRSKKK